MRNDEQSVLAARLDGALVRRRKRPRLIDLFSGAGGLTLGFTGESGHCFESVWANDINPEMVATYNANFGDHCLVGDLTELLADPSIQIPKADVVVGGPPCQGFSLLNRNREGDARKQLWRPYLEVVRRAQASIFVMENVPPLLESEEYGQIVAEAEKLGFRVSGAILCAADYGVPQKRHRAVIVGCSYADPATVFPPRRTHYNPLNGSGLQLDLNHTVYVANPEKWATVRDAIADLAAPCGIGVRNEPPPNDLHFGRTPTAKSIARYKAIPIEGMNRFDLQKRAPNLMPPCWIKKTSGGTDLFGRLWWDRPALTIRTEFYKPEKGRYLHPDQHRPITHREAARLQSFPDTFKFVGTKVKIAIQIGNAVPPRLAARVADSIFALWLARP